jgi:hypothetical protein
LERSTTTFFAHRAFCLDRQIKAPQQRRNVLCLGGDINLNALRHV